MIKGAQIYLRILMEDDASEEYCSWINDLEINKYLETKKTAINELIKYIKEKYCNPNCLFFGIFLNITNTHIGNAKLEPINLNQKKAVLGILIGNKHYWRKGIASEVLNLIISYAFESLELNQIDLGVNKNNIAAINLYKKCGFKVYYEDDTNYFLHIKKN